MTEGRDELTGRFTEGNPGGGRPPKYNEDLRIEICKRLSDGESLRQICRDDHMPTEAAVRAWAIDPDHPFSTHYARAKETAYHSMAEELMEIADDGSNDWMEREGKTLENGEAISRSRLRVDTRKWVLSKMLPKIYGDKLDLSGGLKLTMTKHEKALDDLE